MNESSLASAVTYQTRRTEGAAQSQEKGILQAETADRQALRMVRSLAMDTLTKRKKAEKTEKPEVVNQRMNGAEHAFALLGRALQETKAFDSLDSIDANDPSVKDPRVNFELQFAKNEPKPRVLLVNGSFKATYDLRLGGTASENPSVKDHNEYELLSVNARIRNSDGSFDMVCLASHTDSQGQERRDIAVRVEEEVFIESYLLAQHNSIQANLDKPTGVNGRLAQDGVKDVLTTITQNAAAYAPDSKKTSAHPQLAQGADAAVLTKEGGDSLRPSTDIVKGLAERMKEYVDADTTRAGTTDAANIEKYIKAIDAGERPGPEAIVAILKIAGEPKLKERQSKIDEDIAQIEAQKRTEKDPKKLQELEADLIQFQKEKTVIRSILNGTRKGNTVLELFQDLEDGKGSPDLAKLISDKLKNISDPMQFFEMKASDLDQEGSLASILAKHFAESRGMSEAELQYKISWLKDFFERHGQDIALMGIFALFQMMSGIVGDAVRKA